VVSRPLFPLYSLSFSLFSQIPDTLADRYARIHHDYQGDHCSTFDRLDKPDACQEGSDDAQAGTIRFTRLGSFLNVIYRIYNASC
jgi:hypothetical protein